MSRWRPRRSRPSIRGVLLAQIDVTVKGVDLAIETARNPATTDEARISMAHIEHEGDEARATVVAVMSSMVTTPLDREDLFRASRSIDDVLDNTRDFVREMSMWAADAGPHAVVALRLVRASLQHLRVAVETTTPTQSRAACLAARKEAGQVRRAYQEGLGALFEGSLTMQTLKVRDLLRRLDVVGLRLTGAADALLDGLIKRTV